MIWLFEIDRKDLAESQDASRRAVDRALKRMWEELGRHWQQVFLPSHFDPQMQEVYGYQQRSAKYRKYKRHVLFPKGRAAEPETDLVRSGRSRADLMRPAAIRAFPTRFSLTMRASADYFQMRPYKSKHPPMGEEATRVTGAENDELARIGRQRLPVLIADENKGRRGRKRV